MVLGERLTRHGTREAVYPPWYTHREAGWHTARYTHREAGGAYTQGGIYQEGT